MSPTLDPPFADILPSWLGRQRWYAGKGSDTAPVLRRIGGWRWQDPAGQVGIETHLLVDTSGPEPVLYHVPLTYRDGPLSQAPEDALIATAEHSELGNRWIYDGCHDPVYAQALLDSITGAGELPRSPEDLPARADAGVAAAPVAVHTATVLRGEQSNTSIVVNAVQESTAAPAPTDAANPDRPVIVKVFRVLHPGANPDVEVQTALARAGCTQIPAPVGALWLSWTLDPTQDQQVSGGHVAFASEFLSGVVDAWRQALIAADAGADFSAPAASLGEATATVHDAMREAFGVEAGEPERSRESLIADVRSRFAAAARLVPEVEDVRDGVEELIAAAVRTAPWPPVQRVHGDYHLGQVLHAPGRGWVLLDFEGEPLRPIDQRTDPTFALRDVAGMLRSFDYVAGSVAAERSEWAARAREAFLAGYARVSGDAGNQALLRLLELDKACYEVQYEARNRPDWVAIPLGAVRRLTQEATVSDTGHSDQHDAPDAPRDEQRRPGRHAAHGGADTSSSAPDSDVRPRAVDPGTLSLVARGEHHSPHDVLGAHAGDGVVTFRTVRHLAERVQIVTAEAKIDARHESDGVWVAAMAAEDVPDYRIAVTYIGETTITDDPYRFLPTLGSVDQHLISEGRHERLWDVLGAHVRNYPGELGEVLGTSFSVWAPSARAVRVVGDFNSWDGTRYGMRSLGSSGVWELFIPDVGAGSTYKFEICYADGSWHTKADPMARATEKPPATASVVAESDFAWGDEQWLATRQASDPHTGPMSTYEVHLPSWRTDLAPRERADQLVEYVQWLGFTHVELMAVAEHPFSGSWGYQVTSYYAPSTRFGTPDDFRYLVDSLHQAGIGVLVDWVPAHFPKDSWALANFDGTPLYEDPDPMRGEQQDWGTYVFNFGRNEVRNFLVANALYWLTEFHIDGLRVDAVASMLYLDYSRKPGQWRPNVRGGRENLEAIQFLQEVNATAYRTAPGIVMIAEESTAWPGVTSPTDVGGLGFGLKWNMGWMNDTLSYAAEEPINRRYHHGELTFSLVYAFSEKFVLPLSHDEVVHGKGSLLRKMPGDRWQQLAGVRALLAYQWSHPGKQLLFMGSEFAQEREWSESASLDWAQGDSEGHSGVRLALKRLNEVYREHPALWAEDFSHEGFEWLEANDGDHNLIAYLRKGGADGTAGGAVAVIINFAGTPHEEYRIGLPTGGVWQEVFNSDAAEYGGSGVGNLGSVQAEDIPWRGQHHSVSLRVPPLGAVFLVPQAADQ